MTYLRTLTKGKIRSQDLSLRGKSNPRKAGSRFCRRGLAFFIFGARNSRDEYFWRLWSNSKTTTTIIMIVTIIIIIVSDSSSSSSSSNNNNDNLKAIEVLQR
jgi:hypothetical protein